MTVAQGGEVFRGARDGGGSDIKALLGAWCKPVQLFSAVFAGSRAMAVAAQPRLWRVVRERLPAFPDDAAPEPWLYDQIAVEMALVHEAAAPLGDALRQRLAEQGARALAHDHRAVCTIGPGLARRIAALDARGHELVSRRYGGRPIPATRDAAMRLFELRATLDWQAPAAGSLAVGDARFAQLLEDALGGGGDAGAGPRLHAALVEDPRLDALFLRQARLDLVLGAWFAPAGPAECEALIRELEWGGDDSSRLSPAVLRARRPPGQPAALAANIMAAIADARSPPAPPAEAAAPARPQASGRASSASGSRTAMWFASACILLGLLGALLLYIGHHAP